MARVREKDLMKMRFLRGKEIQTYPIVIFILLSFLRRDIWEISLVTDAKQLAVQWTDQEQ